jgi:hypothetical protein
MKPCKWEAATIKRAKLIPAICAAHNSGDIETSMRLNEQLDTTEPSHCYHNRDKNICVLCEEIIDILFPSEHKV